VTSQGRRHSITAVSKAGDSAPGTGAAAAPGGGGPAGTPAILAEPGGAGAPDGGIPSGGGGTPGAPAPDDGATATSPLGCRPGEHAAATRAARPKIEAR
jgi:hypothetical protein